MRMPPGFGLLRTALALRHYRLYAFATLSSNVALWVQRVSIGWLTWELTHSTAWLGVISFAEAAPLIIFGVVAGTLVDRADQIKLLRLTQSLSLMFSAALALTTLGGVIDIWLLVSLVLLRGTVNSFSRPTRMTVVYGLVGRDLLPTALALNSMIFNASRFLGPALGGAIIAWLSTGWAFASAFVLFLPINWALRAIDQAKITMRPDNRAERRSLWAETVDGIRYIVGHQGIRMQLLLLIVTGVAARPISDLFPGFAGQVFDRGSSGLAWLLSFYGAGALIGAAWMSSRGSLKGLTRITLFNILLMGVALLLFVATPIFWIACPLAALIGFAFITQSISNQTLIQAGIHSSLRGRVMSIYSMIAQGVPSLGTLTMGATAAHWHLRIPVAIGAAICVVLWAWSWRLREPLGALLEDDAPPAQARAAE